MKNAECPSCLGELVTMSPKEKEKGFEYKLCQLCNGDGSIPVALAEDFIQSQNPEPDVYNYYDDSY